MPSTRCIGPLHYKEQWPPRATGARLEVFFNILLARVVQRPVVAMVGYTAPGFQLRSKAGVGVGFQMLDDLPVAAAKIRSEPPLDAGHDQGFVLDPDPAWMIDVVPRPLSQQSIRVLRRERVRL